VLAGASLGVVEFGEDHLAVDGDRAADRPGVVVDRHELARHVHVLVDEHLDDALLGWR
jgi:hypothetical protein